MNAGKTFVLSTNIAIAATIVTILHAEMTSSSNPQEILAIWAMVILLGFSALLCAYGAIHTLYKLEGADP